jgi:hypothetical protein
MHLSRALLPVADTNSDSDDHDDVFGSHSCSRTLSPLLALQVSNTRVTDMRSTVRRGQEVCPPSHSLLVTPTCTRYISVILRYISNVSVTVAAGVGQSHHDGGHQDFAQHEGRGPINRRTTKIIHPRDLRSHISSICVAGTDLAPIKSGSGSMRSNPQRPNRESVSGIPIGLDDDDSGRRPTKQFQVCLASPNARLCCLTWW